MRFISYVYLNDGEYVSHVTTVRSDAKDETKIQKIVSEMAGELRKRGIKCNSYKLERANIWTNGGIWGAWLVENKSEKWIQVYATREDGLMFLQ